MFPAFPAHAQTAIFTYLVRCPWAKPIPDDITTKKSKCLSMIYDNIKKYGLDEILESYLVRGQFELAVHMKKN